MALASGWTVVRDRRALGFCWLYPVRDLMGFAFWCASFFGREIVWRDERYRLEHGGRMVACGPGVQHPGRAPYRGNSNDSDRQSCLLSFGRCWMSAVSYQLSANPSPLSSRVLRGAFHLSS